MKMRELERLSGVGRETIRYYINLGLLPAPARPKPNVADYGEEHVRRLAVIRRLQQAHYLPLNFIKTLLDRPSGGELTAFPRLGADLTEALGLASMAATIPIEDAARQCGLPLEEMEILAGEGVIRLDGERRLSPYDLAIAGIWAKAKAVGFSPANGFFAEDLRLYAETIDAMSKIEVERFYTRLAGGVTPEEVARLGQAGIELFGDMVLRLRTRRLLEAVNELNLATSQPAERRS